jgi:hypothetical protein
MISFILVIVSVVLAYATYNLLKKNERYETEIENIYTAVSVVLHTMRAIDEKQMFETDDEVGSVFQQLNEILDQLRPIIYGTIDEEKN